MVELLNYRNRESVTNDQQKVFLEVRMMEQSETFCVEEVPWPLGDSPYGVHCWWNMLGVYSRICTNTFD